MKRLILIIMTIAMCLSAVSCGGANRKKPEFDKNVSVTAGDMAKLMGVGLSLGNTMESFIATDCDKTTYVWMPVCGDNRPIDYETCWGAIETTQEIIDGIKSEGFDTLRIPVYWGDMMENDGTWTINSEYMARVREIVDYADNAGLFIVVNCHHFDEFIIRRHTIEECSEIFTTLWTQIAEEFKDYGYNLVFEGFNEYLGGSQFDESGTLREPSFKDAYGMTNACNKAFVEAVRATGAKNADRVLIISGYNTNIDRTTESAFKVPADTVEDRLMVSVHYVDNAMYWQKNIGSKEWLEYTDAQIKLLEDAFLNRGIPVFMGETTSHYPDENISTNAVHKKSAECLKIILDKLMEKDIVPVLWDICDHFYSRTNCRITDDADRKVIQNIR